MEVRSDRCLFAAGRLAEASKIPVEGHLLLRENVATCLHQLKDEFVERLADSSEPLFTMRGGFSAGDMRWTHKVFRELEKPYSDAQVFERVGELQGKAEAVVAELMSRHQPYPCTFFITGSLLKGRFGANSDLDLVCGTEKPQGSEPHGDVSVQLTNDGESRARAFGAYQQVKAGQLNLLEHFTHGLESKGYRIEGKTVVAPETVVREQEVVPQSGMIWSFADLP
ncbi:MAG: hypothetical protein KC910_26090 [Candidatus Eremiobacteraeota bacterium]|nr:hypothetical protein [Candidatus Eremiobacteraeota bacterium]